MSVCICVRACVCVPVCVCVCMCVYVCCVSMFVYYWVVVVSVVGVDLDQSRYAWCIVCSRR